MISTYIIIDATLSSAYQYMGKIQAGNGKVVLQKFIQSNCMNAGQYDIHKYKCGWEATNVYGSRFVAIKEA